MRSPLNEIRTVVATGSSAAGESGSGAPLTSQVFQRRRRMDGISAPLFLGASRNVARIKTQLITAMSSASAAARPNSKRAGPA